MAGPEKYDRIGRFRCYQEQKRREQKPQFTIKVTLSADLHRVSY
jgi:hypothetical protein